MRNYTKIILITGGICAGLIMSRCSSASASEERHETAIAKAEAIVKSSMKSPESYKATYWSPFHEYTLSYYESSFAKRNAVAIDSAEKRELRALWAAQKSGFKDPELMKSYSVASASKKKCQDSIYQVEENYYKYPEKSGIYIVHKYEASNSFGVILTGQCTVVFDNDSSLNIIKTVYDE